MSSCEEGHRFSRRGFQKYPRSVVEVLSGSSRLSTPKVLSTVSLLSSSCLDCFSSTPAGQPKSSFRRQFHRRIRTLHRTLEELADGRSPSRYRLLMLLSR